eukprot:GFYU01000348.1.p1 GENE.GFYU01000348.1~~GFYU01000348.1.p1  ORF type:complete len:251 (+),score=72.07 GFYU01000348.1:477-1229(+)
MEGMGMGMGMGSMGMGMGIGTQGVNGTTGGVSQYMQPSGFGHVMGTFGNQEVPQPGSDLKRRRVEDTPASSNMMSSPRSTNQHHVFQSQPPTAPMTTPVATGATMATDGSDGNDVMPSRSPLGFGSRSVQSPLDYQKVPPSPSRSPKGRGRGSNANTPTPTHTETGTALAYAGSKDKDVHGNAGSPLRTSTFTLDNSKAPTAMDLTAAVSHDVEAKVDAPANAADDDEDLPDIADSDPDDEDEDDDDNDE